MREHPMECTFFSYETNPQLVHKCDNFPKFECCNRSVSVSAQPNPSVYCIGRLGVKPHSDWFKLHVLMMDLVVYFRCFILTEIQ